MTFVVPEEIAVQFVKHVPACERSSYVAEALANKLKALDRQLVRACEAANRDPDVLAIEVEMGALIDEITNRRARIQDRAYTSRFFTSSALSSVRSLESPRNAWGKDQDSFNLRAGFLLLALSGRPSFALLLPQGSGLHSSKPLEHRTNRA